ncbi:MAG TPA: Hpt domain-containing protein, partial [Telmatospirillum sp.]|nr:Hpt domain-containing protein [Telmatospirillum sp.]
MALDVKRFTARFVEEARDHLRRLEDGVASLKEGGGDIEAVNTIFRSAHTIKGSSRMLRFAPITETAHSLEEVLGGLRGGRLTYSSDLAMLLQRGIDAIARLVDLVAEGQDLGTSDQILCDEMQRAAAGPGAAKEMGGPPAEPGIPPPSRVADGQAEPSQRLRAADTVRVPMSRLDELVKLMGEVVSSHARLRQRVDDIQAIERLPAQAGKSLRAFTRAFKDDVLAQELLMTELHRKALVMRMLPLAMIFETAPRMVRDLGRSVGKDIECIVSGAEIELDRQLIDRLSDPVVHLLRNAVDHGIEAPAIREQLGKPKIGRIHLRARQDSGGVVIEIGDDGGGVDLPSVRDKAVRKGLMTAEQAAALSEAEVVDLIFRPGFSTSAIITDVSGRGVGMDVVKRCIVDELQGSVDVESRSGHGVTFALH